MPQTYIALDLETTGFNAVEDQVIEIAAVKFTDGKVVETFDTLINPEIPVPSMITHITGLKNEDLVNAPHFEQIKDKLIEFIGPHPIVGHNISFDVTFLNQKGLNLINPLYDTVQLAGILMPGLASYSLDTLTRILKITHTKKHRAMSDTMACMELFFMLEERISQIDPDTFKQIENVLGRSTWSLSELFMIPRTGKQKAKSNKKSKNTQKQEDTDSVPKITADVLTEENILNIYSETGPLAQIIQASGQTYEPRAMQQKMTAEILKAFKNNSGLLVEAGTGTGKTMAYLLAAIYWSLTYHQKVVISSYTINLQQQIFKKDLPLIKSALQKLDPGIKVNAAILKGRKNYLSLKRLEKFLEKDFFMDHEVSLLIKVLLWIKHTQTGDLEELSVQNKEFLVLEDICCSEYVCPHEIPEFKNGCYLMKARAKAEQSDIIVVNHALLLQDAMATTPLLPESGYLIVDEAHHLEKVATDSFTITLSFNSFLRSFEKLLKISENLMHQNPDSIEAKATFPQIKELKNYLNQIISRIDIFFGLIGIFMEKNMDPSQFQYQLNLKPYHLNGTDWQKVRDAAKSIGELGMGILQALNALNEILKSDKVTSPYSGDIKNSSYECERRLADLKTALQEEQLNKQISWVYKAPDPVNGSINMKSAPYSIGQKLSEIIFKRKKSVILTSATLRTDHSFSFIREQLSLDNNFTEIALPSHFAYPDQVKILIPEDLPEPMTEGYFLSCCDLIYNIIKKNGGRTLILFTSKKALSATYHKIAAQLKVDGFTLLAQNITGGRGKIIEHFKDEPGTSAILGTASFWEGVDIPGHDLTCVVMQKLPFDPPEDPIILARSQKYHNSFGQFQLPRAILKFKQGFGRLIRSSKDTGSIIILDSRITQKSYGRQFLESLPEGIKIEYCGKKNLTEFL